MFNARQAAALTAGNHLTIEDAPGLRLVATESRRTWTYRYKSPIDGRMRQIALGAWPALGLPGALAAWERVRTLRGSGVDPAKQKRTDRATAVAQAVAAGYSVRALCDEFVSSYRGTVAPKTSDEVERMFRVEVTAIEHKLAAEVTRADAFDIVQGLRSTPVLAKRLRQALGAAWDHALDSGRLPPETPNWWRLVLRGKLPSKGKKIGGKAMGVGKRTLGTDEIGQMLRWLPNFGETTRDALTLYFWTCCRGAEIVAMEPGEITREADGVWWTVPRAKLKMHRNPMTVDLRVPLVGRALEVVERRLALGGRWMFPSRTKRKVHTAQDAIGAAVYQRMPYTKARPVQGGPAIPVIHWTPHDLRRTCRTQLAALGCPKEIGEAIIGHLAPGVEGTYDRHTYNDERRAWLTRLSERLEVLAAAGAPLSEVTALSSRI